ncbi:DNA-binding transcriptional regulator, MarR family [Ornithinibacillus halophilus]|uniref:DNA-binding transcriptional regulator, MarR family n=1 Tax=Ornithinibacillus halophilus TaxID=930117 RepID=A0A1M5LHR0_9BACI|nr:DNA-binding transcriptional regulator, MarR family [Ornithinibacillus halophilus]
MKTDTEYLDIVDLISERHLLLRKHTENLWNENSDIYLSNSEWVILSKVYEKQKTTISYVTKHVDITRQATHKFIKRLDEKGLVEIKQLENNKKQKSIELTTLGKECYEKNEALKAILEKEIANKVGKEKLIQLKEILEMDWGL